VLCALACHSINAGEPQLTRVGKGSRGRSHLARVWEMCPFRPNPLAPFPAREGGKFGGGEVSLRVGPKTLANPQPTGVGKWGVQGAKLPWRGAVGSPHGGGLWGVSPHETKRGGRVAHPCNPATSGAQATGEPSAYGGGQRGSREAEPPWRGAVGGVPPQIQKRGRGAHINKPATSGTQTLANPKPTGVGTKGGPGGASPPGRGLWGMCPHQFQKGGK
jgi:hypothetical protein